MWMLQMSMTAIDCERRLDVAIRSRRPQANSWRNHEDIGLPGYALSMTFRSGREPSPWLPAPEHFPPESYV
jgi:hypothetical protein